MNSTSTKVTVREAAAADFPTVFIIRAKARAAAYKPFLPPKSLRSFEIQNEVNAATLSSWNDKAANYLAEKDVYIFRVATMGGKVVGWSLAEVRRDELYLMRLFVDPEYQGHGVGSQLLKHLYPLAGDKPITLSVLKPNLPALIFYKKHGFKEVRDAKHTYLGIHRFVMEKPAPHVDKNDV
jgi:ribosomal protein S18 acetylase RimI-like enzyme